MPTRPDDPAAQPLGQLLRRAADLVDALPVGASVVELREAVTLHAELAGRLEAEAVAWVGAFDAGGVAGIDGVRTTAAWLASRTEIGRAHAGALVLRARDLRACPEVAAASADGRLGSAKVRALLDARRTHPELFALHEQELVATLAPLTVAHARVAIAHWRTMAQATREFDEAAAARSAEEASGRAGAAGGSGAGADGERGGGDVDVRPGHAGPSGAGQGAADDRGGPPEGAAHGDGSEGADAERTGADPGGASEDPAGGGGGAPPAPSLDLPPADPAAGNALRLSQTFEGRWVLDGELDPVSGAELEEAIASFIDQQFQQGTYRSDDGLTAGFRRAQALIELVLRGSTARRRHGDPRPSVIVRIDPATLAGIPAADLPDALQRDCGLDDGTPADPRSIERLLCSARVQALWTRVRDDGTVETLGVTDLLRDATRAQRRALKERDGRCVFPGCGAPAEWCDAHHLHPAEDLGPTLMVNLTLLCRYHHHLVHEGGWTLWRDETSGALHLVDPAGRERPVGPHGVKQPVLHPERTSALRAPPTPPHLRPPRFRSADAGPAPPEGGEDRSTGGEAA
jgi:hypothetical protein